MKSFFRGACILLLALGAMRGSAQQGVHDQTKHYDLSKEKPDWQSVIGGNAVAPALETSYGIAVLSDGRMLSSCTSKGNVIWKKGVKGKPSKYFTVHDDFIYVVTNEKKITLVNQSGLSLWTMNNSFSITENPVIGHDGRIFVHGRDKLACFGINGIRKWEVETPAISDLPTCLLNDGSVVVFLADKRSGKTIGKRFTQFGEEMEDLVFSDEVVTVATCEKGVLVALANGSIGLVNVVKGEAESPWIQKSYIGTGAFAICYSKETEDVAFMFETGGRTTVIVLKTDSGAFLTQFTVGGINSSDLQMARATKSGFFVADGSSATEFAEDGTIFWDAKLPERSGWNYLYYTGSNHLIFCMNDWVLRAYHTMQAKHAAYKDFWDESYSSDLEEYKEEELPTPDTPDDAVKQQELAQADRDLGRRMFSDNKLDETEKSLKKGDYGKLEAEYQRGIKSELKSYEATFYTKNPSQSFFAKNPAYTQRLIKMTAQIGCAEFTKDFVFLLRNEKDPQLLSALVYSSGSQARDPDGDVLTSYQIILRNPALKSNEALLMNICDATYEICRYMGRPALNKHGKEILSQLYSTMYDKAVRDYARKTFEKFASLNM